MPCHVARYKHHTTGEIGWAVVSDGLYPLDKSFADTREFLKDGRQMALDISANLSDYAAKRIDEDDVDILSPITAPCRLLCQGSNYPQSRIETGMDPEDRSYNMIFHKSDASITSANADIIRPVHVQLLDYEVEMAVVIGEDITHPVDVTGDNIHRYVAGVVMVHDVTARDIQIPQGQFFKGKSYRTFCPTGPYLCLLKEGEMHYLQHLNLTLSVNDELRQTDHSGNMIFTPHETLTELSRISNLAPGDMLLTGSPGGCALSVPPTALVKLMGLLPERLKWKAFIKRQTENPQYLKPGDQIESQVKSADGRVNLGTQRNRVVAEQH